VVRAVDLPPPWLGMQVACGPVGLGVESKKFVMLFNPAGLAASWLTPTRPVWESVNMIGSSVFAVVTAQLTSVRVGLAP